MQVIFLSFLTGLCLGFLYGHMFLSQGLYASQAPGKFNFSGMLNSFLRLICVIVAIIIAVFYIKLNFIWILLGFIGAFWGSILLKIRAKR
jgi:hypothetical protein